MNTQRQKTTDKTVFLFGPTAVGKTGLLCSLFSSGYEVVNADSVQVYKGLDIGSAKASKDELQTIKHHLIDILDPWENYSVADFIRLADIACAEIRDNGKIPVLSGGTAFYFKNFLYGLSDAPQSDPKIRMEVSEYVQEAGLSAAHAFLASVDPISAARINVNDSYRISRAIEVYKTSGRPLSSFAVPTTPRNNMDVLVIGLKREKEELSQRIRQRVDQMFSDGLVEEIKRLINLGANSSWQSMQAIGYSEFIRKYEENKDFNSLDFYEIKEQIIMNSIHYAKRQMTFFNSFNNVFWCNPDNPEEIRELLYTTCDSSSHSR